MIHREKPTCFTRSPLVYVTCSPSGHTASYVVCVIFLVVLFLSALRLALSSLLWFFFSPFFLFLFSFSSGLRPSSGSFFSLCSFLLFEGLLFLLGGDREKRAEVSGGDSEERGGREYKGPQERLPAVQGSRRDQKIRRSRGGRWSWTFKLAHKRS